jgi:hypothetical protein
VGVLLPAPNRLGESLTLDMCSFTSSEGVTWTRRGDIRFKVVKVAIEAHVATGGLLQHS